MGLVYCRENGRGRALLSVICAAIIMTCASCGFTFQEQLYGPIIIFPDKDRIHAHVQCVLSREFKAHQLHLNVDNAALGTDRYELDIGYSLADNAGKMARSVFSEVIVTDRPEIRPETDLIIIPKVNYIGQLILDGDDAGTSMEIEWTILDKNREVLKRIIIEGEGHGKRIMQLNYFQANQEVLRAVSEDILKDVFNKSLQQFYMNTEIADLVKVHAPTSETSVSPPWRHP